MYIVTDLTRFRAGNPDVCTALVDFETGTCVRPIPYFTYELMRQHSVLPGAKFEGTFLPKADRNAPHTEDCTYSNLKHLGPASKADFSSVLQKTLQPSVSDGFGFPLNGQKVIPISYKPHHSIITIKVAPESLRITRDIYNEGKLKIFFVDQSGFEYKFISITDLGFFDYAYANRSREGLVEINKQIQSSSEIFLRVGMSRAHAVGQRNGYWIQINGIYSFPNKIEVARGYGQ